MSSEPEIVAPESRQQGLTILRSAKNLTQIVYALQAVSVFVGVTYIVAVIVNYVKREEVSGTWLESHFRWQIRTFWFSLLWSVIGFVLSFIFIGYVILAVNGFWVIYRIAKGWLNLAADKAMPLR